MQILGWPSKSGVRAGRGVRGRVRGMRGCGCSPHRPMSTQRQPPPGDNAAVRERAEGERGDVPLGAVQSEKGHGHARPAHPDDPPAQLLRSRGRRDGTDSVHRHRGRLRARSMATVGLGHTQPTCDRRPAPAGGRDPSARAAPARTQGASTRRYSPYRPVDPLWRLLQKPPRERFRSTPDNRDNSSLPSRTWGHPAAHLPGAVGHSTRWSRSVPAEGSGSGGRVRTGCGAGRR